MKHRHVLAVLALSYLTLGIYVIYWLYKTRLELLAYSQNKKAIPKVIVLFIPCFVLIGLAIISSVASASFYDLSGENAANATFVITLVLMMAGILAVFVVAFWWQYHYFRTLEATVQGNDAMLLYVLWIILTLFGLGPIWVLLVQSDLNKFIENNYHPLRPAHPQGQQPAWQAHPAPQQSHNGPQHQEHGHHDQPDNHPNHNGPQHPTQSY